MKKIWFYSIQLMVFSSLMACGSQQSIQSALGDSDVPAATGADSPGGQGSLSEEPTPVDKPIDWPAFDWDNKHKDALLWNEYAYESVEDVGDHLLSVRPNDIESFCPNYDNLNIEGKKMFWISLLAAMSRFESSFNPDTSFTEAFNDANGNRVVSRGLLQLSIESSLGYKCPLDNAQDLHDADKNLDCSVRIMDRWVDRDEIISGKVSGKWRGGARYWSVLRKTSTLNAIKKKTRENEVCR